MEQLDVLEPQAVLVDYRGERLEIQPLTVGTLPRLVRTARPVLNGLLDSGFDEAQEGVDVDVLLKLIDEHGEAVFSAVAIAIGRDRAWVEGGNLAEFIRLAQNVLKVNRDFFTESVAPLLAGLRKAGAGIGATASSS